MLETVSMYENGVNLHPGAFINRHSHEYEWKSPVVGARKTYSLCIYQLSGIMFEYRRVTYTLGIGSELWFVSIWRLWRVTYDLFVCQFEIKIRFLGILTQSLWRMGSASASTGRGEAATKAASMATITRVNCMMIECLEVFLKALSKITFRKILLEN